MKTNKSVVELDLSSLDAAKQEEISKYFAAKGLNPVHKCGMSKDECKDVDCKTHGKKAAHTKEECTDKDCSEHGSKALGAGAAAEVSLKRADVISIVTETVEKTMEPVTKAIGDLADTVKSFLEAPARTVTQRRGTHVVGKDEESNKGAGGTSEKSARELAKEGDTRGAIERIRERPMHVAGQAQED